MAPSDETTGKELAELARQVLLRINQSGLPQLPGLKGTPPGHFELFAGVYRRATQPGGPLLAPGLGRGSPVIQKRLLQLGLGTNYVLFYGQSEAAVTAPDGRLVQRNAIVRVPKIPLDRPGALVTMAPLLDSVVPDEVTLNTYACADFTAIHRRVDLVWDDAAAGRQVAFRYPAAFDYETPRLWYQTDANRVKPPATFQGNNPAPRINEYHEYLANVGTYDASGGYYRKWKATKPKRPEERQFHPTFLSDEYLRQCFIEAVMKKGDDLLWVDIGNGVSYLYRLLYKPSAARATAKPRLTVNFMIAPGTAPPDPAEKRTKKVDTDDTNIHFPVRAVVFRAVDGGNDPPKSIFVTSVSLPETRYAVDYKAYVRFYYGKGQPELKSDQDWLKEFTRVFFPDTGSAIELNSPVAHDLRERLFLKELRDAAAGAEGPIGARLSEIVAWCDARPTRMFFFRDMQLGTKDNPRLVLGLGSGGDMYELHPATGLVTRMALRDWLNEFRIEIISDDIYQQFRRMLTAYFVVNAVGVTAILGGPTILATLANVSRIVIRPLIASAIAGKVSATAIKAAVRAVIPTLLAMLIQAVMSLFDSKDKYFQLFSGIVEGFGTGAIDHYLEDIDHRLGSATNLITRTVTDAVTLGFSRAVRIERVLEKIRASVVKATGLVNALKALSDEQVKMVAQQLRKLTETAGTAFLIIIFVLVYLDYVMHHETNKIDKWAEKQQQALRHLVAASGQHVHTYLTAVRADIKGLTGPPTPDLLTKHDAALAAGIEGSLAAAAREVAGITDLTVLLLRELGVKDWAELKKLGFVGLLAGGFGALEKDLKAFAMRKLGVVLGEFVGTIVLERAIIPKSVRTAGGGFYNRSPSAAVNKALGGGTWRALWRSAIHPFSAEELANLTEGMRRSLQAGQQKTSSAPKAASKSTNAYRDLLKDLVDDGDELANRLLALAGDAGLEQRLRTAVDSAIANRLPPTLEDLLVKENHDWPSDAVMFVLLTWLRIGLLKLLEAFQLIEAQTPHAGGFKLHDLIEVIGLDVSLDADTLEKLLRSVKPTAPTTP